MKEQLRGVSALNMAWQRGGGGGEREEEIETGLDLLPGLIARTYRPITIYIYIYIYIYRLRSLVSITTDIITYITFLTCTCHMDGAQVMV
jgi:hypothetical protein